MADVDDNKPRTAFLFCLYIGLFVAMAQFTAASKDDDGQYPYNPVLLVFLTDCLKLVIAVTWYIVETGGDAAGLVTAVLANKQTFVQYFVPAGLYALYNILQYENIRLFDPTMYFLLLQSRVIVVALVYQVLFRKKLSSKQWIALFILMGGCILSQLKLGADVGSSGPTGESGLVPPLVLMLIQILCSCFAGVYNEYLIKTKLDAHVMVQNIYMYGDSILINFLVLGYQGQLAGSFTADNLSNITGQWACVALIINNACIGIVVSLFLKYLNSILKVFASAMEIVVSALFSWMFFYQPITAQMVVATLLVGGAIVMYTMNPPKEEEKRAPKT